MHKTLFNLLLIVLAAGLFLMLGMTVKERITNPSLVQHVTPARQAPQPQAAMDESPLARLMRQVGDNPNDAGLHVELAQLLVEQGRLPEAQNFLERAAVLDVHNATIPYLLGYIAAQQGEPAKAIELMEDSVRLGENVDARYSLGILYQYFLKNSAKAREHWTKALGLPGASETQKATIQGELDKLGPQGPAGE